MLAKDNYGRHECLDRSMLALEFVDSHLLEHEGLMTDERALAERAHDALFRLYQLIGERHL